MSSLKRTPALSPKTTPLALATLLAMSPAPQTLAAEPAPAIERIDVNGKRQHMQELPTMRGPVIDMPQLVTTVTADTLQQRQVVSLEDALRNVAGVTTQIGEGGVVNGDQFFIRGQAARNDIFTDGLRDFGAFTRDSFNFEQVAVLKGPSSTALGRGVSGGAINSGSKLPVIGEFQTLNASVGSASYRRAQVDINHALSESAALRLNVMAHENNAVDRDLIHARRWGLAGAVGFGLNSMNSTKVLFFHQQENRVPDYGVPVISTTAPDDIEVPVTEYGVSRKRFYGYSADTDKAQVDTLTLLWDHLLSPELSLSSATKIGRYSRYFRQTVASCPAASCGNYLLDNNTSTVPMASMGGPGPYEQDTSGIQNVSALLYTRPVAGMRNELAIGLDVSRQRNARVQFNYQGTRAAKDLFSPLHEPAPMLAADLNNERTTTALDYSLFIDDRLWLYETVSVDAGVRVQRFSTTQDQLNLAASGSTLSTCDGKTGRFTSCLFSRSAENTLINPKLSAVWEPQEWLSAYVSWSRSSVPPGNSVGNGDALAALGTGASISSANLDPEHSSTVDIGLKFSMFNRKLLVQTGLYQTRRSNAQETDPQSGVLVVSGEPEQQLRGFELGLSGAVSSEILLTANYAYIDARIIEAFTGTPPVLDRAAIGKQVRYVPEHAASVWASWRPSANTRMQGFEFGAGLSHQSKVYLNLQNTQEVPAYTAFDAMAAWNWQQVRLSINGYNLGNARYYSQVNGGRVVPAAGRSVVASLHYQF